MVVILLFVFYLMTAALKSHSDIFSAQMLHTSSVTASPCHLPLWGNVTLASLSEGGGCA